MASCWDFVYETFLASIRSVGTACTLAGVGTYMHQRGLISVQGKRMLALISQQVTFPLFLFTKIIYCNQDWSRKQCPNMTESLSQAWILLFWPLFVVSMGVAVGQLVSHVCQTPFHQRKSVMAAVAFGNSTGLPITLLTVVHTNFYRTSDALFVCLLDSLPRSSMGLWWMVVGTVQGRSEKDGRLRGTTKTAAATPPPPTST